MKKALVGIIIGSESDFHIIEKGLQKFKDFGVDFEVIIASAHRTPEAVKEWSETAEERGIRVIIAAAGMAAHLPGVVASHTILPVIGIPIDASPMKGVDSLYSIVQMPSGIPVATVGINAAENAAVLATEILAINNPEFHLRLKQLRSNFKYKMKNQNINIKDRLAAYQKKQTEGLKIEIPLESAAKVSDKEKSLIFRCPAKTNEIDLDSKQEHGTMSEFIDANKVSIKFLDPNNPDPFQVEKISDLLLDGGIIGIPTDTIYGIACDATSQIAVKKIFDMKNRSSEKSLPIMVHNMKLLKRIIPSIPQKVEQMLDDLWPGALTVIFKKSPGVLKYVSATDTIGVRIPNNYVILSIISLLGRPLAVTSANISGEQPLFLAKDIQRVFGSSIDLIVDSGHLNESLPSTVIDVSSEPYKILRDGAIPKEKLKEYLGDSLV